MALKSWTYSDPSYILKMEIEQDKKNSYLDEYKILKTLGAGYHAQ